MIAYFLLINFYCLVFICIYAIWLRKSNAYLFTRLYLCGVAFLSLLLPTLKLPSHFIANKISNKILPNFNLPTIEISAENGLGQHLPQQMSIEIIYFILVAILLFRFAFHYIKMHSFLAKQNYLYYGDYRIAINTSRGPASFYKTIILPTREINESILRHELTHIRRFHFYDKIFLALTLCFFPLVLGFYFIKKELEMLHEYEADASACYNVPEYAALLLNQQFQTKQFSLTQTFYHHPLKNRIMMLSKSKKIAKSKKLLILGTLSLATATMVFVQSCANKETPKIVEKTSKSSDVYSKNTVAVEAEFPGGMDSMISFLSANIAYPKDNKVEGTTRLLFKIDEKGLINNVEVTQLASPSLDSIAVAAIRKMPRWTPAKDKEGNAIASYYNLPIQFKKN